MKKTETTVVRKQRGKLRIKDYILGAICIVIGAILTYGILM
jgi:hypothetical protein